MPRFSRLAISGYRSIQNADLKLGAITTIIGPSDCGKSNSIRAIRDWAFNATGADMITKGRSICRVSMIVDGDNSVTWEKHRSANKAINRGSSLYKVNNGLTNETVTYEKIGRDVPDDVVAITGIREAEIDDNNSLRVQIAEQAEAWFLLSKEWSPARVCRVIGHLSGIETLLSGNHRLISKSSVMKKEVKKYLKSVTANESKVEMMEVFNELSRDLSRIEAMMAAVSGLMRKRDKANDIRRYANERKAILRALTKKIKKIKKFDFDEEGFLTSIDSLKTAETLLSTVVCVSKRVDVVSDRLERIDSLPEIELSVIDDLEKNLSSAEMSLDAVKSLTARIDSVQERISNIEQDRDVAYEELEELAGSSNLTCPICGEPAHEGCRESLRNLVSSHD